MRSRKNIIYFFVGLVGLFLLSCKQKNSRPSMIGKWEFVSFTYYLAGNKYSDSTIKEKNKRLQPINEAATGMRFDFMKDSIYTITPGPAKKTTPVRGKFSLTGKDDLLMTPDNGEPDIATINVLNKNTLKLYHKDKGIVVELKKLE